MELDMIRLVQSIHSPFLDRLFEAITMLGEELFIVPLLAVIFWAKDKKFGEVLAFTIFTSLLLNNSLKDLFSFNRPIGEEGIRTLRPETATGKSFPSGHSQNAGAAFGAIAIHIRKNFVRILSGLLIILIGLSRIYLGVHYPKDAAVGILLGLGVAYLTSKLVKKMPPMKLYIIVLLIFIPAFLFAGSLDFIKSFASYLGFTLGIWLERTKVNFSEAGTPIKKTLRVILGILLVLLIKEGLKPLFPEHYFFDFIRYFLVTFVAIGIYPMIFKKIKL